MKTIMHIVPLLLGHSFIKSFLFGEFALYRFDKVNRLPLTLTRSREINYGSATTILLVADKVNKVEDAHLVTSDGEEEHKEHKEMGRK